MNNFFTDESAIIACSTATTSNAAIGVIRISGFVHLRDFQKYFNFPLEKVSPRKIFLSQITDGLSPVDEVVGTYFAAPHSFNGENILELSVHGNKLNIQRIIDLFISTGLVRFAHPGEFTFRALKNKKLALSQVEGLDLLLNAQSQFMLTQGQGLLHGQLNNIYLKLHESFIQLKSSVELAIDFLEDVGEEASQLYFQNSLSNLSDQVENLYRRIQGELGALTTPEVILLGQTNAGKSSLFNKILNHNRSIVSAEAGTTRDYISEYLSINQTSFRFVDTAGIRESGLGNIEKEGILRSWEILNSAFFKILVINPFQIESEFWQKINQMNFDAIVFTHTDYPNFLEKTHTFFKKFTLPQANHLYALSLSNISCPIGPNSLFLKRKESVEKSGPIGPNCFSDSEAFSTFSEFKDVLKDLLNLVDEKYRNLIKDEPIIIERHRNLIQQIYHSLQTFKNAIKTESDAGIISFELNTLGYKIEELIGITTPEQVLTSIFKNFCIGK